MLTNTRKILAGLTLATLMTSPLIAAAAPQQEQGYGIWNWAGHLGTLNIDSKVAREQGVDDAAFVFGGTAEHSRTDSILSFLLGLDFVSYDDNYNFSQDTNKGEKSSSASAMLAYAEFGPKIHFGADQSNYLITRVGLSTLFGSERSIDYCSNCYSESIDIDGGPYGVVGIGHSFGNFAIGLQYQQYFSGDLDNSLRFNVSTSF